LIHLLIESGGLPGIVLFPGDHNSCREIIQQAIDREIAAALEAAVLLTGKSFS